MAVQLSPETQRRVELMFAPSTRAEVTELLVNECGANLPLLQNLDEVQLERFRFAALKLSDGSLEKLHKAIALAKLDWRDLLASAGFHSANSHTSWLPKKPQ